jgi:hypothetical protein
MNDQNEKSFRERIERLEKTVAELRNQLGQLSKMLSQKGIDAPVKPKETAYPPKSADKELPISAPSTTPTTPKPTPTAPPKPLAQPLPTKKKTTVPKAIWKSEYWLNKIGIGLVLFAAVFLFKYSIDQGWLTPPVRVGFGLVLGIALLAIGIRIHAKRRHFSQVLLGGGIATFYITGFATFQLYSLVSYPIAMVFMIVITLLAFFLSIRKGELVLSLIGALGGLGTPFLLYTGTANLPGLIGYTCLVLAGTSAIYFYKGWRSLLWTSVIGGWAVFLVGYIEITSSVFHKAFSDYWALQWGFVFGWFIFWALPVMREVISLKNPDRWTRPTLDFLPKSIAEDFSYLIDQHVHLLSVITPLVTLIMSRLIWTFSNKTWGLIAMGGTIIYGLVSWNLKRWDSGKRLAYTHMLMALVLLTIAFCLLLEGNVLFFTLMVQAVALHIISKRLSDKGLSFGAHVLFIVLGIWLGYRIFVAAGVGTPILNAKALTDFFVIVSGLGVSVLFRLREVRYTYQLIAHIAFLGWLLKELSALPNGQAYVTIAWGLYAIALLIIGLRLNLSQIRAAAMVTLLVVVGKLFLVDLAMLKAIWRILLFFSFGVIFLVISYYFQALWRQSPEPEDKSEAL